MLVILTGNSAPEPGTAIVMRTHGTSMGILLTIAQVQRGKDPPLRSACYFIGTDGSIGDFDIELASPPPLPSYVDPWERLC